MKFLLATLCAAGVTGTTTLATTPHHALSEQGLIERIDMKNSQLTVKDAHKSARQVFTWNQDTQFLEREHRLGKAKTAMPAELKAGERAFIRYEKDGDHLIARKIVITREPHAAAKITQPNRS